MEELYLLVIEKFVALGYPGIVVMMFLESSFIPFPSEIVMIPAGYLAAQGKLNLTVCIVAGIVGSLGGAALNYLLGATVGRAFLVKYGKYFFLPEKQLERMEKLFEEKGSVITLTGRLIPGVRQYISFPAGITKMPFLRFSILTSLGAGSWVIFLSLVGFYCGENEELIKRYMNDFKIFLLVLLIIGTFFFLKKKIKVREESL